jgi:hypothetical protein
MLLTRPLTKAGLAAARRLEIQLRHQHYNREAKAGLRMVESQQGRTDPAAIRRADEYAREMLGSIDYAPWLRLYTAVSGGFREGWIPDNYYGLVVAPLKAGEVSRVALVKSFTQCVLRTDSLPDLAYVIDGLYFARDYLPIPRERLEEILFAHEPRTVFKADQSFRGRNVFFMTRESLAEAQRKGLPDGVFQAPVRQHEAFASVSPRAAATLRITSAREPDGSMSVRSAYLRVGRASDDMVVSATQLSVPIEMATGTLLESGYTHEWHRTDAHPDTGARFAGLVVPFFREALQLCLALHRSCPHMLCVGWDLCIDRQGQPRLLEWNARYNGVKFPEATTGPCFRGLGWEHLWRHMAA